MAFATNLGFARIGANRQLKKALESYWSAKISQEDLLATARAIRAENWRLQSIVGLDQLPADFSLYDHVLDTAFMFDSIPQRFRDLELPSDLDLYFAMARGSVGHRPTPALEMTKWFDTNYHYMVPEFLPADEFRLARPTALELYREAATLGHNARPVILGPLSFLLLGKAKESGFAPLGLLDRLLPAYEDLFRQIEQEAEWVQVDEPVLSLDLDDSMRNALTRAMNRLATAAPRLRIFLATYFGPLQDNLETALRLPIAALHLDLTRSSGEIEAVIRKTPAELALSLGIVDGRNTWKTDLERALATAERISDVLASERIFLGPSCSLLHTPVDLTTETQLDAEIKDWMAFGKQKLEEVVILTKALNEGRHAVQADLEANADSLRRRRNSSLVVRPQVRQRANEIRSSDLERSSPFPDRAQQQHASLQLPTLPTTTIGSFPQTGELRQERARMRRGDISPEEYDTFLRREISYAVEQQEQIGLDVLVHGEAERNDMVEYFGELLQGFAFTQNGWVQSYGSRCVKPPVIYGDVARPNAMTVDWWRYAQSLTERPMKGMLTGPVTILQWSFVRDDQPRSETCQQIALAIRDETLDLEAAGCRIIQIDEPAIREGLPLRRSDASAFLQWAVDCFRLASAGVSDWTQIHTHMCYAEFNDIVDAIVSMDADVISIESTRSQMESLNAFGADAYRNEIGPGVYDIHSPRVPSEQEIVTLLEKALRVIPADRLWVNPDCGLKTRRWKEVIAALGEMVSATRSVRAKLQLSHN